MSSLSACAHTHHRWVYLCIAFLSRRTFERKSGGELHVLGLVPESTLVYFLLAISCACLCSPMSRRIANLEEASRLSVAVLCGYL